MRKVLLATAAIAAIGIAASAPAEARGGHGGGGIGIGTALLLSGALGGGAYGAYGATSACPYGYTYTPYGLVPCATGAAAYGGVNPWLLYGLGGFGGGHRHH